MSAALRSSSLLPAAALLAWCWQAPQTGPAAPPALRITGTLVQVDAAVTDLSGRRVPGLGRSDFQILQDGQPQKIAWFSYVPEPPSTAEDSGTAEPAAIASGPVRRTAAIVVDDTALCLDSLVRTREGLHKYVERAMQPGDRVALVRTGGGVAILEQFTTDKRILLEAVDLLKWQYFGRVGIAPIDAAEPGAGGREPGPQAQPEALDYGYSLPALGALRTLEEVIAGMKRFPGRKSIVYFADPLLLKPELTDALDHIVDLASRSAVSLYTIDPGGWRAVPRPLADKTPGSTLQQTARHSASPPGNARDESAPGSDSGGQDGLSYLAARTGGLYYRNPIDIPGAIREAVGDQLGYYRLGYSPGEGTFEENPRSAGFHTVTVRVNRPGLNVRWNSGFEGVPDEAPRAETASANQTRERQLAEALASPFAAAGIRIRLTSWFMDAREPGPRVHSQAYFDARDLTFVQEPGGMWNAKVDFVSLAYCGVNQNGMQSQRVVPIHLPDDVYRRALKEGFTLNVNTPALEPGACLIRAVVRDWASQRIGSASRVVSVPEVRKGQLAMSGVVVKLASNEILKGLAKPDGGTPQDANAGEWSEGGPAVRRFRPGQIVSYGFAILNPTLAGTPQRPQLTTQVRLYCKGKLVLTGGEFHDVTPEEGDPTRYVAGGILRLDSALVPGEYILQATVTDGLAPRKNAQVSEWMDFEVVGPAAGTTEAGVR
jgi:VWFA-related protein